MANPKTNTTQDLINNLQELKCKTNLKFHQNTSNYYGQMNYGRPSG